MGLTARTALAFAATAILAVGLSALVVSRGLDARARQAAEQRLRGATTSAAKLAGNEYRETGRWNQAVALELARAASISGYRALVFNQSGALVKSSRPAPPGPTAATAGAVVHSGGRRVGSIRLELPEARLQADERDLSRRVMRLDLLAAMLAVGGVLLAVPLLASTVVRPIRRLHDAVDRLRDGTRVPEAGPREIADLARRFNSLSEALTQEEGARRAMAADVAHELRTPLNGLLLRIEAAQDEVLDDPQRNLQAMHTEARRLGALIEDVEALAEAERPGVLMERKPVDMAEAARGRLAVHAAAFREAGIELHEVLADGAIVDGDPARLAQVLDNLLTNALRYTDRGGDVTIAVHDRDHGVAVDISDTGVGIAAGDLPHVFDRFWRADRSRSRTTGGSGVGLAVVQRLVAAHGGRIHVESEPGRGTSFHIWLPRWRV
jgi:two-component system sensor histidine kinase BaeS